MGRVAVVAIVCAYFVLLFALGGHSSWNRLGVPDLSPSFLDMRSVTSGWECTRQGIDILPLNPCDPLKRPANYPRIWMAPAALGLGQSSTVALGLVTAAVFFAAAVAVFNPAGRLAEAAVYGAALCSPAVMLGVERGNVDLLLFALVVAAVILIRRGKPGSVLGPALVLFAAVLKLFPIFSIGLLARQRRRTALVGGGLALALFGAYALATLGDIRTISKVVPQANAYSYGIDILGRWLGHRLPARARFYDAALAVAALAAAISVRGRLRKLVPADDADARSARDLDAFWAGASVYVGTFVLFHSFDYRLVFLLLTIPQLLRWARQGQLLGLTTLGFLVATLWLVSDTTLAVGAVAQLLLFACLVAALAATAPGRTARLNRAAGWSKRLGLRGRVRPLD